MQLRLLGQVTFADSSGRVPTSVLEQPKRLALLAYLSNQPQGGKRRRDTLLGLFWPGLPTRRGRHALRQALYVLRRELGEHVIYARGDSVRVAHQHLWCDVIAFDDAMACKRFEEAAALYGGDLLDGVYVSGVAAEFEHWLDRERDRLRASAKEAFSKMRGRAELHGDWSRALGWAQRAVHLAPFDEPSVRHELRLLERTGNRAGAMNRYRKFEAAVRQQFDVRPSDETRALMDAIRSERPLPPNDRRIAGTFPAPPRLDRDRPGVDDSRTEPMTRPPATSRGEPRVEPRVHESGVTNRHRAARRDAADTHDLPARGSSRGRPEDRSSR